MQVNEVNPTEDLSIVESLKSHTITEDVERIKNFMKDVLKSAVELVETYLKEFCTVNGIKETELKNHLIVGSCFPDVVQVANVNDQSDVKFGVRFCSVPSPLVEVSGEYLSCKDKFPITTKKISRL